MSEQRNTVAPEAQGLGAGQPFWASPDWLAQLKASAERAQKDWASNIVGWHPAINLTLYQLDETDADFVAAARPDTILALLAHIAAQASRLATLEAAGAAGAWVPVGEQLPKERGHVLVHIVTPDSYRGELPEIVSTWFDPGFHWEEDGLEGVVPHTWGHPRELFITHWHPLPAPPTPVAPAPQQQADLEGGGRG